MRKPNSFLICKNPKTLRKMVIGQRSDQVMGGGSCEFNLLIGSDRLGTVSTGSEPTKQLRLKKWCDNKNKNKNNPTGSGADSRPQSPRVSSYKCKINKPYIHIKQYYHHRRVCLQQQLQRFVWPRPLVRPCPPSPQTSVTCSLKAHSGF